MTIAGQAIENLSKGLFIRDHPEAINSSQAIADGEAVLKPPANSHNAQRLLAIAGIPLDSNETNIARRLELAVTWHGRYPIPMRLDKTSVQQLDQHDESVSIGFWSSTFRQHVDGLYSRLHAELVEPGWIPWWEADKHPI